MAGACLPDSLAKDWTCVCILVAVVSRWIMFSHRGNHKVPVDGKHSGKDAKVLCQIASLILKSNLKRSVAVSGWCFLVGYFRGSASDPWSLGESGPFKSLNASGRVEGDLNTSACWCGNDILCRLAFRTCQEIFSAVPAGVCRPVQSQLMEMPSTHRVESAGGWF